MALRRIKLTFPPELVTEPIIYQLGKKFKVVTDIRRADINEGVGWVVLELIGDEDAIKSGLKWVASNGVRVDPVVGDVIEG